MLRIFAISLLLVVGTDVAAAQDAPRTPTEICAASVPASEPETRTYTQAEDVLEPGVDYRAIFCTGSGPIYVDLYEDYTPLTVNNFVFLAQSGYYNNTTFHRVMQDFMAQGGDPTATGTGGPGYQFEDEFVGFLNFDRPGLLAMANAGPDTNGSQFFITTGPASHLNLVHTVFGEVLEGQENVASIQLRDPASATQPGTALQTVVIITDPESVLTAYEEPAEATQEEVESAMDSVRTILDEQVSLDESATGTYTSDQLAALVPEGLRQDYADYLTRHNFQYRVASRLLNAQCDLVNIGFTSVSYTLDAYASRDDAAAALDDEFFGGLPLQNGYAEQVESENLAYPMFTVKANECDREVIRAVTSWQRGRFVVTAETSIPADSDAVSFLDLVLVNFVGMRIYEPVVADVLRREIR